MDLLVVLIGWVVIGGWLITRYRSRIVQLMPRHVPLLPGYLLIATPFILVEELFTCDQATYGECVPRVLPSFWILLAVLYLLQRHVPLSWRHAAWAYGVMGCIGEFFIVGRIWQAQPYQLILLVPLCILIYRVVAIIPAYWLEGTLRKERR